MQLRYYTYDLIRKHPFTISGHTTTAATVVFIELDHEGLIGRGEASPGHYLPENAGTITSFLASLKLQQFRNPLQLDEILDYADNAAPGNTAAKAALDMALHDLAGKLCLTPCHHFFHSNAAQMPLTSYTIGIDHPDKIREKVRQATDFSIIKVKLGSDNDKAIIDAVRAETNKPVTVDANQGWTNRQQALDMIGWLNEQNVLFVEQPMPASDPDGNAWVTAHSPLPVIADEAVLRLPDVKKAQHVYHGINIKLVKCSGMREGYAMLQEAQSLGLKTMIGCMGESSNAIMAAAALAPLCDWVDLDSPWLIANNPYKDPVLSEGRILLNNRPGLGLEKRSVHSKKTV